MRRVVITGLGIVSCLGNNQEEVHQSLLNSKSGISYCEEYKEHNLKSHIHGKPNIKLSDYVDRKSMRFMGSGSAYNYVAMKEAIKDSGLEENEVSNIKTGIIMGSGGPSIENVILAADKTRAKTPKLMGPFIVPRTMASRRRRGSVNRSRRAGAADGIRSANPQGAGGSGWRAGRTGNPERER